MLMNNRNFSEGRKLVVSSVRLKSVGLRISNLRDSPLLLLPPPPRLSLLAAPRPPEADTYRGRLYTQFFCRRRWKFSTSYVS